MRTGVCAPAGTAAKGRGFSAHGVLGLHFVKIKNQDAAANLKITSFRFFLNDFSYLSIQCVL